jgi:hypothetical protein
MAHLPENKAKPHLSKFAFWDIDLEKMDLDRFADFAITRVFERGTEQDIWEIIRYFGEPRITDSLTHASTLQPRAIAVAQKLFGLSPSQFACSIPQQQGRSFSKY